jgi:hypothetical protein
MSSFNQNLNVISVKLPNVIYYENSSILELLCAERRGTDRHGEANKCTFATFHYEDAKKKKAKSVLIISFDTRDFCFRVWRFWTFATRTSAFCLWVILEDSAFQMHGLSEIFLEALIRFIFL